MNLQDYHNESRKSMEFNTHRFPTNQGYNLQQKKEMPEFLKENADYVTIAEKNILSLGKPDKKQPDKRYFRKLTNSKIRNILALVNQLYNKIVMQNEDLPETIVSEIRYLKLRLIYEAGREEDVENFCKVTGVIDALDFIGNSKARYIRYARYMEALVAYHKFYNSEKD